MTLTLCGDQDLRNGGDLQRELLDSITPGTTTVLDIGGITSADLGFVQIIESARRHADAVGAQLRLAAPAPVAVRDVLARAGIGDDTSIPFWTHGADQP
ncbi:STAS domain-containing protein [Novosphingobium sp. FSW06-99]|uniref:STAS domain-containing protein n=1 Tax=Novosphingobium sp. FSW06-99 TaxID=1739113 RepID=UPI00076DE20F|nr:STAS domain-containing protein [Novosphingobium sp. FSW06-99]KUR80232.1 hypothetical protein AQZ49_03920 [Novosphingobium sp. FSW06-99]